MSSKLDHFPYDYFLVICTRVSIAKWKRGMKISNLDGYSEIVDRFLIFSQISLEICLIDYVMPLFLKRYISLYDIIKTHAKDSRIPNKGVWNIPNTFVVKTSPNERGKKMKANNNQGKSSPQIYSFPLTHYCYDCHLLKKSKQFNLSFASLTFFYIINVHSILVA